MFEEVISLDYTQLPLNEVDAFLHKYNHTPYKQHRPIWKISIFPNLKVRNNKICLIA